MALISLNEVTLSYGGLNIFDRLDFQLNEKERVALIGRNGAGKSTLMSVIAGETAPDSGTVSCNKGVTISYLPQQTPRDIDGTTFDTILSGLGRQAELIGEYYSTSQKLLSSDKPDLIKRLDRLQQEMERTNSWETESRVKSVLNRMGLHPDAEFNLLSGGQKRRVLLAKALVRDPDVLLLDEPTNHLDILTIEWLEKFLLEYGGSILFVTHDRKFMDGISTRIAELDRGRIYSWECDYSTFLKRKQQQLDDEEHKKELFDKKLKQEEAWLRQGIKARRTRNQGRVKRLQRMREDKAARRDNKEKATFDTRDHELSGKQVIEAKGVCHEYKGIPLINDFSTRILRGDKVGVIGPNGCGKTTLLKILLGEIAPQKGAVELGSNLEVAYFDQLREQLDYEKSVKENVSGGADFIMTDGGPKHIVSYLKDFLFTSERSHVPVKVLSGGERNRLLLARLFTRPFNLLVMDEPTNDLDIETLELLEELLSDYEGTLILVSHDRQFLNNVVTSTIVFEGEGNIREYPGGYDDWLEQRKTSDQSESPKKSIKKKAPSSGSTENKQKEKLTYREERELESLPGVIAKLEEEHAELIKTLSDPDFYKRDPEEIESNEKRTREVEKEIEDSYQRWEQLEKLKNELTG